MPASPRRNVELKARDPSPQRSLAACRALGAEDEGWLEQRDVYFSVPHGRLKLRDQRPGPGPQLIHYERADEPQARVSRYGIVEVAAADDLEEALGRALGVVAVVEKRRRLFLWRGVRIHLDRVVGLGDFVELEAVAGADSDLGVERARVAELVEALGVGDERLVAEGYLELSLGGWRRG